MNGQSNAGVTRQPVRTTQKPAVNTAVATNPKDDKPMQFIPYGGESAIIITIKQVQDLIAVPTKSGVKPDAKQSIKFMMMCQARRLNPYEGDAYLIGYDGRNGAEFSLITAHQAFLKRAELHPEYDGMTSGIILLNEDNSTSDIEGDFYLPGQKVVGGWATVFFKHRSHPTTRRIRMERFRMDYGVWRDDAAGMIVKCAEADALRSSFPTMCGGLYLREELRTIDVDTEVKTAPDRQVPPAIFSAPNLPEDANAPVGASGTTQAPADDGAQTTTAKDEYIPNSPGDAEDQLWKYIERDGITEEQLIAFCKLNTLCGPKVVEIKQLKDDSIMTLVSKWAEFGPKIKAASATK